MTNEELAEAVLESACKNHMWVSALVLVRPSDETLISVGRAVVQMLQDRENLLPHFYGEKNQEPVSELQKKTPVLYMSINAS